MARRTVIRITARGFARVECLSRCLREIKFSSSSPRSLRPAAAASAGRAHRAIALACDRAKTSAQAMREATLRRIHAPGATPGCALRLRASSGAPPPRTLATPARERECSRCRKAARTRICRDAARDGWPIGRRRKTRTGRIDAVALARASVCASDRSLAGRAGKDASPRAARSRHLRRDSPARKSSPRLGPRPGSSLRRVSRIADGMESMRCLHSGAPEAAVRSTPWPTHAASTAGP